MVIQCPKCGTPWHPQTPEERRAADRAMRIQAVFDEAEKLFGYDAADIKGPSHSQKLSPARSWVAKHLYSLDLTLKEVGVAMGNRDHSTVHHAIYGVRRNTK